METLLVALGGGAVGTVLAVLLAFGGRLLAVPRELMANDRAVRDRDEDLETWVADEHVRLERELHELSEALNKENLYWSGHHGKQIALAKERALHRFRDQERQALRDAATIRDRETWPHLLYRARKGIPSPELRAPGRVAPVLEVWRRPVRRHLSSKSDESVEVNDPSRRTLDDTHAKLAARAQAFE